MAVIESHCFVAVARVVHDRFGVDAVALLEYGCGCMASCVESNAVGFEFTGIELDEEYYNAAKERLILHQRQLNIF